MYLSLGVKVFGAKMTVVYDFNNIVLLWTYNRITSEEKRLVKNYSYFEKSM